MKKGKKKSGDTTNVTGIIDEVAFKDTLSEKYLAYALSTIKSRSLPDVRDGLKPVHRRILYSMLQLKLDPKVGFKKCARIVGDVIGKFHPHGEQAVYSALVRMAQSFSSRYPMVDGQGNFGSIDGDNSAAMRYTEAKLTPYAMLLIDDIDQDTVNLKPNYDGSDEEPEVLPSSVPNILANGTEGIAVGMATNIPPHNLVELCDAISYLLKHPNAQTDKLLKYVKGPDFPTGGILVEPQESIIKTYTTGRGSFRLRAKWHKEELDRGLYRIVVTEIPYQVQKRSLIEKMAELFNNKKMPFLESFQDMSAEDIQVIIYPKSRNIEAEVIMESLFKLTDLEVRVSLNMNVLNSRSVPSVMSLHEVLNEFIAHRREVVTRRLNYRLSNINRRLEILGGLLIAYLNLDEVIRIIREEDDPKAVMIERWKLTDLQVESILNMRLRALRKLEEFEIKKEDKDLKAEKKEILSILKEGDKLTDLLANEIKEIRSQYAKNPLGKRKTDLGVAEEIAVLAPEAFIEKEPITVTCSQMGWLKSVRGHTTDNLKYKDHDSEWVVITAYSTDKIVAFSDHGKFYSIACDKIARGKGDGDPIRLLFEMDEKENIITMFKHVPDQRFVLAAADGKGFVVSSNDVLAQTKNGKQIMVCEPGEALMCELLEGQDSIAVIGENRRLLVFSVSEIPEMKKGRGVTFQKFKQGKLKAIKLFKQEEGLNWFGKSGSSPKDLAVWKGKRASLGRIVLGKLYLDKK